MAGVLLLLGTSSCTSKAPSSLPLKAIGRTVIFAASSVQFDAGCRLEAGRTYLLTARAIRYEEGRSYADKSPLLWATPSGVAALPLGWMTLPLRDASEGCLYPLLRRAGLLPDTPQPRLRVCRDQRGKKARFLTLIATVSDASPSEDLPVLESLSWAIGRSAKITPRQSGRLWLFANDWPNALGTSEKESFYSNNRGSLMVTITPIPTDATSPIPRD